MKRRMRQRPITRLFEGVKSYSQLARLKRTDLDTEKRVLMVGTQRLVVSLELLEAFDMLRECAYLQIGERRLALDQDSDALILPLIRYGQQRSLSGENYRYLSNAISRKMKSLGLSASGLYESGIMDRLVKHFGSEEILTYLLPEHPLEKKWMAFPYRVGISHLILKVMVFF